MSGRESEMSVNEHRRSGDSSCHYMGCSRPLLYNQHRQTSEVSDFFRSAEEMAVSTFRPVGEVDINSRANTRVPATQGPTMADSIKCGMEIKAPEAPENHNDLVWSVTNRKQECQKTNNKFTTASRFTEPSTLSSGCEWGIGSESRAMAVRKLCRNEYIVPSSITEMRATNQNSCNRNNDTRNETTLLELPKDHGEQHTQDLPLLLKLLKDKLPYRDETNKNVLNDFEIRIFDEIYGITDFCLVFACEDSVFWLKDYDEAIYFWSRIDDSMIRGGSNLKEALTNYLFRQENLCYVDEITRELVPINAYDKEVEEWAKSPEIYEYFDATK
ncbi:10901_t:CDS:1, partial [Funneliformis caledonium]